MERGQGLKSNDKWGGWVHTEHVDSTRKEEGSVHMATFEGWEAVSQVSLPPTERTPSHHNRLRKQQNTKQRLMEGQHVVETRELYAWSLVVNAGAVKHNLLR